MFSLRSSSWISSCVVSCLLIVNKGHVLETCYIRVAFLHLRGGRSASECNVVDGEGGLAAAVSYTDKTLALISMKGFSFLT